MNNTDVNIINGAVVGVHLGAPMQDATPSKPEDNEVYATERNTVTRIPNSEEIWDEQPVPSGGSGGDVFVINFTEKNESEGIADKTFKETLEAYLSGRPIAAFTEWTSWSDDDEPVKYRYKCRLYPMIYSTDGYEHFLSFGAVMPGDSYSVSSISYCFDYYEPDDRYNIQLTKGFIQSAEN